MYCIHWICPFLSGTGGFTVTSFACSFHKYCELENRLGSTAFANNSTFDVVVVHCFIVRQSFWHGKLQYVLAVKRYNKSEAIANRYKLRALKAFFSFRSERAEIKLSTQTNSTTPTRDTYRTKANNVPTSKRQQQEKNANEDWEWERCIPPTGVRLVCGAKRGKTIALNFSWEIAETLTFKFLQNPMQLQHEKQSTTNNALILFNF